MPEWVTEVRVPEDHPCLAGHFPGRPVVPAVLLVELVSEALRAALGPLCVRGLPNAKFLLPVKPGATIAIHLAVAEERGRATFRCLVDGRLAARGELAFALR